MRRKDKRALILIIISIVLFIAAAASRPYAVRLLGGALPPVFIEIALFLVPYLCVGFPVLRRALLGIIHGQIFDENFLMTIATIGAFATGEYPEAVFVMLFYSVGELFQSIAVGKSRRSIKALTSIREDVANLKVGDDVTTVGCEVVKAGQTIIVRTGERVPLDGVLLSAGATLNTAALTGESLPRECVTGDEIPSGCINEGGLIELEVKSEYNETTVARILKMVEDSAERKSKSEEFITKFAKYYTPSVVIFALLLAILPPMITGISDSGVWREWVYRALTFLVISCPCALVISVPLAYFGGIGGASRCGVLVKGASFLDELAKCDTVVFDKTGTLTKGNFSVREVIPHNCDEHTLIKLACAAEQFSTHPIAKSLVLYANGIGADYKSIEIISTEDIAGHGVVADTSRGRITVGNERLMDKFSIEYTAAELHGSVIFVALDGNFIGQISISDTLKDGTADTLLSLKRLGIGKTVMLTGDNKAEAEYISDGLAIDEIHANLMPWDKVEIVESIKKKGLGNVAFVGDGINDAPVLMAADIGISMGGIGSDAAIEASDVVLMYDKLSSLCDAVRLSKKTRRIVIQNIIFALGVKAIVLLLGALGILGLNAAVFADVGVAVIAILNSMRCLGSRHS
ncbi:MAG: cadmium-translocating P-type ATPase [Clostridia bacterium]|nr:cadmium-translocating P-type ATPase [Clostridia bacterium]